MTVGSGRLVQKAKEVYREGVSQDWGDILGKRFINFSTASLSVQKSYICPDCKNVI